MFFVFIYALKHVFCLKADIEVYKSWKIVENVGCKKMLLTLNVELGIKCNLKINYHFSAIHP